MRVQGSEHDYFSQIICIGATIAVLFSDHDTPTYSVHDLRELWCRHFYPFVYTSLCRD